MERGYARPDREMGTSFQPWGPPNRYMATQLEHQLSCDVTNTHQNQLEKYLKRNQTAVETITYLNFSDV